MTDVRGSPLVHTYLRRHWGFLKVKRLDKYAVVQNTKAGLTTEGFNLKHPVDFESLDSLQVERQAVRAPQSHKARHSNGTAALHMPNCGSATQQQLTVVGFAWRCHRRRHLFWSRTGLYRRLARTFVLYCSKALYKQRTIFCPPVRIHLHPQDEYRKCVPMSGNGNLREDTEHGKSAYLRCRYRASLNPEREQCAVLPYAGYWHVAHGATTAAVRVCLTKWIIL